MAALGAATVTEMSPAPVPITPLTAVLFPGQGSSVAGARPLIERFAPELLDQATSFLGRDPLAGADESTRYAQPAIFIASIASWREIESADGPLAGRDLILAGHSLGELSALTAAGVFDAADALDLVMQRAALMDASGKAAGDGGMLALLKGTIEQAQSLAAEHGVVVGNDNAPGQVVLSGDNDRLAAVSAAARPQGMRSIALGVSGAFHSPAMAGASAEFAQALANASVHAARFPVVSSITTKRFDDVRGELELALVRPVRWRETMRVLSAAGATQFLDVGPGRVLAGLVTRNLGADARVIDERAAGFVVSESSAA